MTDNKLTDNLANNSPILTNSLTDAEIIKALTICSTKGASCKDCPAFVKVDRSNCKKVLLGAIDIINRLQAEKQNLEIKLKAMRGAANSYKAENEMLKKDSKDIDEFARNICRIWRCKFMIHELKILPKYFADVVSGKKQFEVRKDDRPFHEGDLLALNEFENKMYTGNSCLVYIDYILRDSEYVKADYVILGIKPCAVHRFGTPYNPCSRIEDYSVPYATKRD